MGRNLANLELLVIVASIFRARARSKVAGEGGERSKIDALRSPQRPILLILDS